jgi:hypothetical protein
MHRRSLRNELRDVFEDLSEPAHPALSARIRERMEGPAPSPRVPRLAVAMAVVTAAVVVGSLVFFSRHVATQQTSPAGTPAPAPAASATPTPVPAAGASPTPAPRPSGTPSPALPAFTCAQQSGGAAVTPPPLAGVTMVRLGPQSGYDRFVIQFNGPVPQYDVTPQGSATFVHDASGAPVTLSGSAGLLVTLHSAQSQGTYTGSTDLRPAGTAVVQEARQVGDYEGVVHWGLGLSNAACFRAFTLAGPSRLVVDVQG